jgi:hypothetical protein
MLSKKYLALGHLTKLKGPLNITHANQIINPFLNSRILANHDKVEGFKPMVIVSLSIIKSSLVFLSYSSNNIKRLRGLLIIMKSTKSN